MSHALDEAYQLRHQVDHQEEGDGEHDGADEGRVDHHGFGLRGHLVLPFERFGEVLEHVDQASAFLTRAGQAHGDLVESVGVLCHCLR